MSAFTDSAPSRDDEIKLLLFPAYNDGEMGPWSRSDQVVSRYLYLSPITYAVTL